jgi:hypothetical protein
MTRKRTTKRPEQKEAPAAFTRFQTLTKALLGMDRKEYEQNSQERPDDSD